VEKDNSIVCEECGVDLRKVCDPYTDRLLVKRKMSEEQELANQGFSRYSRKGNTSVTAVKMSFDTDGFLYQKWGGMQECKAGDWVVTDGSDTWTVDGEVFSATYQKAPGNSYKKVVGVWAKRANSNGHVSTKEGKTHYSAGDYIVANSLDDMYAMKASTFHSKYTAC
jgi:hypothetical protein